MDDTKLVEGKNYLLKIGTQRVPATIMNIKYKIDVNTGEEVYADAIYKNEIARCEISVASKIVFDKFEKNNALGSLILIDRVSHMTSACGVVEFALNRSDNLTWQNMDVTREFREHQLDRPLRRSGSPVSPGQASLLWPMNWRNVWWPWAGIRCCWTGIISVWV